MHLTGDPGVVEEFRKGLGEIKSQGETVRKEIGEIKTETKKDINDLNTALKEVMKENAEMKTHLEKLRKQQLAGIGKNLIRTPGQAVSEDCAKWLSAIAIQGAEVQGKLTKNQNREALLDIAAATFGLQQRAALTSSDIPMPVNYAAEVVELVLQYGMFRRYATVYPLTTLTTKLPKLSTSPAFGLIAQSATVTEKSPQVAFVTFTALKSGGLIRIPTEIDADSIVQLGQFLARYIAREMAKWEDTFGFNADGSGTYNSQSGVCKSADTLSNKVQLTAGNSNPSTITLANLRTLRAKPDAAALQNGAYYMHQTMEALLCSFNTSTYVAYQAQGPNGPTLEGFPIRWIGVMPIYDTTTHLNQYQVAFGDLSYWYFGERAGMDVQISRDVFFATDEIALRALERFDIRLMADNSMAVLQLAAS